MDVHEVRSALCGISLKGADIVVRGSVGHMSALTAQTGSFVVCGDAGDSLGDSRAAHEQPRVYRKPSRRPVAAERRGIGIVDPGERKASRDVVDVPVTSWIPGITPM